MYKILVADDEKNIREVIREYAEFEGHEVKEAVDGMQVVEMAKNEDFDIIILDVMMPKLDGFSACKEIRKTKNTPAKKYVNSKISPCLCFRQGVKSTTSSSALR